MVLPVAIWMVKEDQVCVVWCQSVREWKIQQEAPETACDEFIGRHSMSSKDRADQMCRVVADMVSRTLTYDQLIADSGLPNGAWS